MDLFEHITSSRKAGIFSHMSPDGDALGCCFAMGAYLEAAGKEGFRIFLPSPVSESLRFMIPQGWEEKICVFPDGQDEASRCDLLIGLDFNTPERIGGWEQTLVRSKARKVLIDHHLNPACEMFDLVHSKTDVSSACELLYSLLKAAPGIDGIPSRMSSTMREALMTGMTTDTNNFANSVYPSTLRMASELLECGTDRDSIIQNLFFRYPMRRIKAQGYVLEHLLRLTPDGVAYIILDAPTQKMLDLQEGDTEGFVNIPLSAADVRMSIMLKQETEEASRKVRVSIRSKEGTSAQLCAKEHFHGGGHTLASGGRLMIGEDIGTMADAERYIVEHTHRFLTEE